MSSAATPGDPGDAGRRAGPDPAITIRRMEARDAAAMARILGDPEVLPNLMQVPHTSEEIWARRLAEHHTPGNQDLHLVAEIDGVVVGSSGLHLESRALRRRHAAHLGISIAREAQGRGVGHALMTAMCAWADDWAQLLRLELQVFADNARAIRLYERHGFVQEGLHRAYAMRDGRYVDSLSMARLHPRQPLLPGAG
jgi:putative acetyltransferase